MNEGWTGAVNGRTQMVLMWNKVTFFIYKTNTTFLLCIREFCLLTRICKRQHGIFLCVDVKTSSSERLIVCYCFSGGLLSAFYAQSLFFPPVSLSIGSITMNNLWCGFQVSRLLFAQLLNIHAAKTRPHLHVLWHVWEHFTAHGRAFAVVGVPLTARL